MLFLGDTYANLKQKDKAKEWYQKAAAGTVTCEADKAIVEEAKKKLGSL